MSQFPIVQAVFKHLEEWWSFDNLRPSDATTIAESDSAALQVLFEGWPNVIGEVPGNSLPALSQPSNLRPIFGDWVGDTRAQRETALRLLLYSPSVVVDSQLLEPFYLAKSINWESHFHRREIAESLEWLIAVRPLLDEGLVLFADKTPQSFELAGYIRDPLLVSSDTDWVGTELENMDPEGRSSVLRGLGMAISGNIQAGLDHRGTPVALNLRDETAYRLVYGGAVSPNRRVSQMSVLARFPALELSASPQLIADLRRNDESFQQVRAAMHRGFQDVDSIDVGPDGLRQAQGVIYAELHDTFEKVSRMATGGNFVKSYKPTIKSLGFLALSGVAATVGLTSPADVAIGSLAVPSEVSSAYRARRDTKAIWDVVLSFRDPG